MDCESIAHMLHVQLLFCCQKCTESAILNNSRDKVLRAATLAPIYQYFVNIPSFHLSLFPFTGAAASTAHYHEHGVAIEKVGQCPRLEPNDVLRKCRNR